MTDKTERPEVDLRQVLLTSRTVVVELPANMEGSAAEAVGKLIAADVGQLAVVAQFQSAMRPMVHQMIFEAEAAERGALLQAAVAIDR